MGSLEVLKKHIIAQASREKFIHHEWFIKYHIQLAEKLALELCKLHPEADQEFVLVLIWFHDYGKIIDFPREHVATQEHGFSQLVELGFEENFANRVMKGIALIDEKDDLVNSEIEIQIASSADGASHMIGPFYLLFWKEHPDATIEDLLLENNRKLNIDWNKKIILPEVRRIFEKRLWFLKEQFGELPKSFIL